MMTADSGAYRAVAFTETDPHGTIVEIDDLFITHWLHGSESQ
jgi:hypothetical protein